MDMKQLASQYHSFLAPSFEIRLGGMNLVHLGTAITEVEVDASLHEAAFCRFRIGNVFNPTDRELRWIDDVFTFGKKIQISFGYADRQQEVFSGILTSIRTLFLERSQPEIEISGYDLAYPLTKGRRPRAWEQVRHSDVVRKLADEYHIRAEVEETEAIYPKLTKLGGESDWHFIRRLALHNDCDVFVRDEKLLFRKPLNKREPRIELEWGRHLIRFSPEVTLRGQQSKVQVRGWNIRSKQPITGEAGKEQESAREPQGGRRSGAELVEIFGKETAEEHWDYPVFSQQEADILARSLYNRHAEVLMTGVGEMIGVPDIRPGDRVVLGGLGSKFSRPYDIKRCIHRLNSSGYRTIFYVKETTI